MFWDDKVGQDNHKFDGFDEACMDDNTILALVTARAADAHRRNDMDPPPTFPPPISAAALAKVEQELGYSLPPLLRRVYTEIGDVQSTHEKIPQPQWTRGTRPSGHSCLWFT